MQLQIKVNRGLNLSHLFVAFWKYNGGSQYLPQLKDKLDNILLPAEEIKMPVHTIGLFIFLLSFQR